ncbi:unnamed protein product [Medioppia subpectinata]|uniref:C2H2-type domain-containing protein n=1 Tax=Medioppia subpectinata TaxID=1979941 RepID=A0A7R9KF59_9ACAR|nr:unnamed protein product [Medioppia subpectinata]CAG2102420.1 unnamed protein product [Medioppia subpectinata]
MTTRIAIGLDLKGEQFSPYINNFVVIHITREWTTSGSEDICHVWLSSGIITAEIRRAKRLRSQITPTLLLCERRTNETIAGRIARQTDRQRAVSRPRTVVYHKAVAAVGMNAQTNPGMMYVLGSNALILLLPEFVVQLPELRLLLVESAFDRRFLSECDKLKQQIKDIKLECDRYKQVMIQLNDTIVNGNGHGSGMRPLGHTLAVDTGCGAIAAELFVLAVSGKGRKYAAASANHACQSCCAADKPYICDWQNCGKRFRKKPHLDTHKNIHTGRRFSCDWPNCGKSFVRKYNLIEHRKLHSSVNPNVCEFANCGKFFSSKYSLMRHQSVQHGQQ